ncbi:MULTISPECIES: outer membrane protein [Idiomarina]|uniref:outer membrane protein n=1 Tax=Idiomarina TaxID=135575 RepID=UPI000C5B5441|nr:MULTISPECIES: outer membrane beta-barrel protein [Idiomarina]MBP59054.1 porin [Idiomarina sp.]|tara:strand:- start:22 stop:630 length:609 start_codon:yes stop_codon:yes gene_type:complete
MKKTLIAIALIGTSTSALADSPNWNKLQASYIDTDIETPIDEDISMDGYAVSGSLSLNESIFILANFDSVGDESEFGDVDLDSLNAGIGFNHGITKSTDIFATVTYEKLELVGSVDDIGSESFDESGYGAGLGVRSMLTDFLELSVKADYLDIDDENAIRYDASAFFHLTENLSLGVGYKLYDLDEIDQDIDTVAATVRYSF